MSPQFNPEIFYGVKPLKGVVRECRVKDSEERPIHLLKLGWSINAEPEMAHESEHDADDEEDDQEIHEVFHHFYNDFLKSA